MASSTVPWMPSSGRHQINIGPSFGRAIKARKLKGSPAPTTKRSNFPERDFYFFRYNFKPGAIDSSRPASIEVKKAPENTQILAEFPSKELSEVCTYSGSEIPAKEVECILIYDEETGQYTLEKLDSVVSLQFGGKRAAAPSAPSPATEPSSSSTPLANPKGKPKQDEAEDELERLLLDDDDNRAPRKMDPTTAQRQEEEEEEEEEEAEEPDIPLRVSKRPAPPISPNPTTKITSKSKEANTHTPQLPPSSSILAKSTTAHATPSKNVNPSQTSSSALSAPKPPKSTPKKTKRTKAAPPPVTDTASNLEEEIIEIERPAKKPRISMPTSRQPQPIEPPKPKATVELSLPGGQSTFVAPPVLPGSVSSKKTTNVQTPVIPMAVPPGVSANIMMEEVLGDEEEEDEEWEAVPTHVPAVEGPASQHEYDKLEDEIFGPDFGEDDALEAELNEQMGMDEDGDEDDDMVDVMQEAVASASTNKPISLNRLAGGMPEGESDDDFSSSDSDSD